MKNVILLTIDTLRKDVLGCYGNELGLTPFIDSIQDKCIRFNKAQSTGPYTQASFPGILTSSYYLEHVKEEKANKRLSGRRTLLSEVLQREGIITAGFHSNAYLWAFFGWNRGWYKFYDSSEADVDDKAPYIKASALNHKVAEWLSYDQNIKDKPLFLWVHYMDVHEPYVPARRYIDRVDPGIKATENEMMDLFKNVVLKRDSSNPDTVALLKKLYLAHVNEVDDATKEFFVLLEQAEILKDSTVIIASDHGDEFAEHGGLSHDGKMFSELIDVPLIIYDPSLQSNQVCDTIVSNLDISPTIVHLFGVEPVAAFQGHSLLPLEEYPNRGVYGQAIDKHTATEKGASKGVFFFRDGDLKIIYREKDNAWELYDLKEDPKELNNIADQSPATESMMKRLMPKISAWTSLQ
jgi:arylsulfatase A-like enzyme